MEPFLPLPYRIAGALLAGALVALLLFSISHHQYKAGQKAGRAEVQARWNDERVMQQMAALAAARAADEETRRRLAAQQDAQRAHDLEVARAKADADAARAAARSLRAQLDAFVAAATAGARGGDPAPVGNGAAAGSAVVVLAELFRRADGRAGELAESLDAARAAGLQCQREYGSLKAR